MRSVFLAAGLVLMANAVCAQSVVFSLGYSDFTYDQSSDTTNMGFEYHHSPFYQGKFVNVSWGATVGADTNGDYFAGAGLIAEWPLRHDWFVEFSVRPGYYNAGEDDNGLGGNLQFRSLIAIGKTLSTGNAVSLGLAHASNASTNPFNPGVNTIVARFHIPL